MAAVKKRKPAPKKLSAIENFTVSMGDATWLVDLAEALENNRTKRMFASVQQKVGKALNLTRAQSEELDWIESDHLYVIMKGPSTVSRDSLADRL